MALFKKGKKEEKVEEEEKEEKEEKTKKEEVKVKDEDWFDSGGELAVDVYHSTNDIVIQAPIAGIKPSDLDITIEQDSVKIKGERKRPTEVKEKDYLTKECYYGLFSREVILPVEIDGSRAEASMKDGILTIKVPKIEREAKKKLKIKEG